MANCGVCGLPTNGHSVMMALGLLYHPACFICAKCHEPFQDGAFYQHQGQLLCETDFIDVSLDKCAKCNQSIDGQCYNVFDTKFHPDCFCCHRCHIPLKGGYMKFDDKPFCRQCHDFLIKEEKDVLANCCHRCKKRIDGPPFIFRGNKFHAYHFNCTTCKLELNSDCKEHEGKLYCPEDYARAIAPACFACRKLIFGQVLNSMGKTFHAVCFCCAKCETQFSDGIFYEYGGQALCELHHREATGTRCARCLDIIQGDVIEASGKQWCDNHFICAGCDHSLAGSTYGDWDGRAICAKCFTRLPLKVRKRLNEYRVRLEKRSDKSKGRTGSLLRQQQQPHPNASRGVTGGSGSTQGLAR